MARNGHHLPEADKRCLNAPRHGSLGEEVLSHAQAGREIVQDLCRWRRAWSGKLGGAYLRLRGNKAFLSDASPVPFIVNNDGALSRNAADVFFASLVVADKLGQLERDIVVLELGIGVGLFARYFLDCMRDLCRQHKKDYYDRLCYIAADRSERMLQDVLRHGVLADHRRYRLRQLDALRPEELFGVGQDSDPATPFGRMEILPHDGGDRIGILPHGERLRAVCALGAAVSEENLTQRRRAAFNLGGFAPLREIFGDARRLGSLHFPQAPLQQALLLLVRRSLQGLLDLGARRPGGAAH